MPGCGAAGTSLAALAAAKKLEAAMVEIVAAAAGRPKGDWPF